MKRAVRGGRGGEGPFYRVEIGKAYIPLRRITICVGSLCWLRPQTPQFRVGDTNMLVSKNDKICVTPNANPQCESVEYRLRWVPNAKFSCWPCAFHFHCVDFICVGSRVSVEYGLKSREGFRVQSCGKGGLFQKMGGVGVGKVLSRV